METYRFDDLGELEDVSNRLARATRHPVYADLGAAHDEDNDRPTDQSRKLGKYAIWNNRDDQMVYFGSNRYNLIQHREVIDSIRTAVENTEGSIEKGVVHDYGSKVDGVLVFGDQDKAKVDVGDLVDTEGSGWRDGYVPPEGADFTEDVLGLGMRFQNSFDGRTKVGGSTMGYRFICQNWMVWGEETIAESTDMHLKSGGEEVGIDPGFFEDIIGEVFDEKEMLEEAVERSVEDTIPLGWVPEHLQRAGFGRNYARGISAEVRKQTHPSEGETTLWHVYNAATSFIEHEKAPGVGPTVFQGHHENAWRVLETPVEEPETAVNLKAFASA